MKITAEIAITFDGAEPAFSLLDGGKDRNMKCAPRKAES